MTHEPPPDSEGSPDDNVDAVVVPARAGTRWWALAVLAAGLAMIIMDGTIVAVALPTIISQLNLSLDQAQWVNSLYSVVLAALLLTSGHLGDRFGRRRMFLFGIVVFLAGSALAASSDATGALIWARAIQGVGAACILPATLSTVNATFRGADRAAAFGVWGAVLSGAAALGPLLGGWLTGYFSWEWVFLINLPIGVILFFAALVLVPESRSRDVGRGFDMDGLQLSAIGFGALVFAVIEGGSLGWWQPEQRFVVFGLTWPETWPVSIIPPMLLVAAVALTLFVLWERHRARVDRSRLLDLRLFFTPTFSWGNVAAMMVAIGEFGLIFVLPLYLKNALGLSTMQTGLVLATMAIGAFVSGAMARHVAAVFGPPGTVIAGLAIEVVGVGVLALLVSGSISALWIAGLLAVYGIGLGLASAQLTSTVLRDVPPAKSAQGSATQSTVRQVGSAFGTAIMGTVLSVALVHTLGTRAGVSAETAAETRESAGSNIPALRSQAGTEQLVHALTEGFATATRWTMLATLVFLLLGLLCAFRVQRTARTATPAG